MLNLLVYLFTPELPRNLLWSEPVFRGMKPCVLTMQVKLEEEVKLCSLGILNNYIIIYLELSDWSRVAATATWLLHISYGHCCYSLYNSPPFWSGFTGRWRAPGAVCHPFELRDVICTIFASRKAGAPSDECKSSSVYFGNRRCFFRWMNNFQKWSWAFPGPRTV